MMIKITHIGGGPKDGKVVEIESSKLPPEGKKVIVHCDDGSHYETKEESSAVFCSMQDLFDYYLPNDFNVEHTEDIIVYHIPSSVALSGEWKPNQKYNDI